MSRGRLRIIGGRWRGRRLTFPAVGGVRPTPDRVRETLFNWLGPVVPGAVVLDLFAGSGALGLEALSRGAERAVFVERSGAAARGLSDNLRLLGAEGQARVVRADALAFLRRPPVPHGMVFLDPPYHSELLAPACRALEEGGWLSAGAWIYLETAAEASLPPLPECWRPHRHTRAGQVCAHLFHRS